MRVCVCVCVYIDIDTQTTGDATCSYLICIESDRAHGIDSAAPQPRRVSPISCILPDMHRI